MYISTFYLGLKSTKPLPIVIPTFYRPFYICPVEELHAFLYVLFIFNVRTRSLIYAIRALLNLFLIMFNIRLM